MNDTDRTARQSAAFHDLQPSIGGHVMRPLSLASYDVLLRTGNPLIGGETPAEGTPEFTAALIGFVFIHCAPWPDVVRASFDPQRFREESLIFCGCLAPADFKTAFERLEQQSRELEAAQVDPVSGMEKKPLPATSLGS
jgi:hypothetical protein